MTDPSDVRKSAENRLKQQAGFKRMFGGFVIIWIVCTAIWAISGAGFFWPVWVFFGTGIAALYSGWAAYGPRGTGPSEQQIDAEVKKFGGDDTPGSS